MPIVCTGAAGPKEILDESTAFFADLDDADKLAKTLKGAIHNPDEACARAAKALQRFSNIYHVDRVVSRYAELYARLISYNRDKLQRQSN